MDSGAHGQAGILLAILVLASAAPALAQQERVPKSLWGVRGDVGLGFVEQFFTNYGDRSFYEARPSGEDVRVAVVDTGIDTKHPDLDDTMACNDCWKPNFDCQGEDETAPATAPEPFDDNGHGTHVSGIIAGDGHAQLNPTNSYFPTGAWGIAPDTELVVAKAMNATGGGSDECVAEAVRWSLDPDGVPDSGDEPHIVHLSLGVQSSDGSVPTGSKTEKAVEEAIEQGVFVVMSAGNQGQRGPAAPGNVDGVIAVGALGSDGQPLEMSNRGEGVDVFAPGVIMSTFPKNLDDDGIRDGYTGLAGTSQAAPVVTGGLSLVLDANPELREGGDEIKVYYVESLIERTGTPTSSGSAQFVTFDGGQLVAAEDAGTSDWAGWLVAAFGVAALLVAVVLGRAGFTLLQSYVEDEEETTPPNREPSTGSEQTRGSDGQT
jgi:subtilisin family serine protease